MHRHCSTAEHTARDVYCRTSKKRRMHGAQNLPTSNCAHDSLMAATEAFGSITLDRKDKMFSGALRHSSGVSEICGGIEMLLWVLSQAHTPDPYFPHGASFVWVTDSTYVLGLTNNTFEPRENQEIALLLHHLLQEARKYFTFTVQWRKAHA